MDIVGSFHKIRKSGHFFKIFKKRQRSSRPYSTTCDKLSTKFSTSPSKDVKTFLIKEMQTNSQLRTIHAIELVATVNPVNSFLTSTMNKTHHGLIIGPFYE